MTSGDSEHSDYSDHSDHSDHSDYSEYSDKKCRRIPDAAAIIFNFQSSIFNLQFNLLPQTP